MKNSLPKLPLNRHEPFMLPFYSEGEFSLHELIEQVLMHYNLPCIIKLSSFSLTEEAVRLFIRMKENGLIHEISCLFDNSVRHHKLRMLFFGLNAVDHVYLSENHSKCVLFQYIDHVVVLFGSANLQINRKIELGVVTNDLKLYDFFYNKISRSMLKANKIVINDFE